MINWITKTYDELSKEELYEILRLWSEVFIVEQNCVYQDLDGRDQDCWHLMGREGDCLAAYLRVLPKGLEKEGFGSLGRVVLAADQRGTGLGHELFAEGLRLYDEKVGADVPLLIHAQSYLENFYAQHGFMATSESHMFEGRPHTFMVRRQQGEKLN